jgi:excisionase family DNA binding protein
MSETLLTILDGRKTVGLPEVAEQLGMAEKTLRNLASRGAIPGAFRMGNRWRFKRREIEEWWAKQGAKEAIKARGGTRPNAGRKKAAAIHGEPIGRRFK